MNCSKKFHSSKGVNNVDKILFIKTLADKEHLSMQDVKKITGLDEQTLRKLFDTGVISGYRVENLKNKRMFSKQSVIEYCNLENTNSNDENRVNYLYIRAKNKDDAKIQEDFIKEKHPEFNNAVKIIDISKNINHTKKGLQRLLMDCTKQKINNVAIIHKDILGKIYYDMISKFIELSGGTVVNINNNNFKEDEIVTINEILKVIHTLTNSTTKRNNVKDKKKLIDTIAGVDVALNSTENKIGFEQVEEVFYESD